MFDKADDELIQRLIQEAEAIIEEELQKKLAQELGMDNKSVDNDLANEIDAKPSESEETPPKKRRGRPRKSTKTAEGADSTPKPKSAKPFAKSLVREKGERGMAIKEAILEFVEREDGILTLQEVGANDEPLVTISFSEQVKDMIGRDEIQAVGQNMIHAAIATVMQRQMNAWHAHVYDETPKHYS